VSRHLLAYFCSDHSEDEVVALRALVDELSAGHSWAHGPPEFDEQPGEESPTVATEVGDTEAKRLIDALAKFSKKHEIDFVVEAEDEVVDTIESGVVGKAIQRALLER
jgi:hypothetical protein